ncbi:uncharacterized protein LOC21389944 isoform X2 [Morus notabilis]|uniref:uncharacterized protein LOC21389944 isoform X2 n=1 Tax=Morus notabilis TaxID=981085 RepID=UPI000CED5234|nr:uncharacterized protein LOC21389944 isoform X2 [Morus notabilis]
MPIPKLKAANTLDVMKSEEGNDSLDAVIRQAIGKEPFLSFSKAGDSSVQFIQLLQALEQQAGTSSKLEPSLNSTLFGKHETNSYVPEHNQSWSLLSPLKVQMQKCNKCSQDFCSPINYRRHIRVHHRLKKLAKDSTKSRDLLGAFWDKLSMDDAKEVVSFKNVVLEEVPGPSIIKALSALIRKSGFSSLPQPYLKAGSDLLDIVQGRPLRFPISSEELFSVLDHASEKTFLSGPAVSMQRHVFDGEAGKIGLETKNLVACTSFLLEQKLVSAWLADKDAEALRFQKLLVEEEEAAQKRQAELLERKRQKKLRQKEQKAKEQRHGEKADVTECIEEVVGAIPPAETFSPVACDIHRDAWDMVNHVPLSMVEHSNLGGNLDSELQKRLDCGHVDMGDSSNVERHIVQGSGRRRRWQGSPKSQWVASTGFHADQSSQASKLGVTQKRGNHRNTRNVSTSHKVWSRKAKPEYDEGIGQKEASNEPDQTKECEVLIGSISVTLGNCSQDGHHNLSEACGACTEEHQMPKNSVLDNPNKPDLIQNGTSRSTVKLWRPVSRNGTTSSMPVLNSNWESEGNAFAEKGHRETPNSENCPRPSFFDGNSSHAIKAFLAQRWKEAIAMDHVKLVLTPDSEPADFSEIENHNREITSQSLKFHKRSILGDAENRLLNVQSVGSTTGGAAKAKFRTKTDKGMKIKYIPKQRAPT